MYYAFKKKNKLNNKKNKYKKGEKSLHITL